MQYCEALEGRFMLAATVLGSFPLKANAQWVYNSIEDGQAGTHTMKVLPTREMVGSVQAWVMNDKWSKTDLITNSAGLVNLKERSNEKGSQEFAQYDTPLPMIPASLTAGKATTFNGVWHGKSSRGEAWTGTTSVTFTLVRTERITVPAGTFSAIRIQQRRVLKQHDAGNTWNETKTSNTTIWYVKGVGLVKSTATTTWKDSRDGAGQPAEKSTWSEVLKSYSIPK